MLAFNGQSCVEQGSMQENYLFADSNDDGLLDAGPDAVANEWKILIVDDEPEVHTLTKLNLHSLSFREGGLTFLSAFSAAQAESMLKEHDDIAVILLDVVMETETSGLKLVDKIRNEMDNHRVRIVLRTGQPGQAPEAEVVLKYDINDYRSKTDLTQERLITSVLGALRNYADMQDLERSERERHLVEEKAAARSLFLATVSHEIRTPMHGILGTLELLTNTNPDDDQLPLIKVCQDSATYLLSIIDDILDFSKIDAGKLEIAPEKVQVADLVYGSVDQLSSRAWLKDIDLVAFIEPGTPEIVTCDPKRVQQVLINLVGNAIKFTESGHVLLRVNFRADQQGGALQFAVEDSGVGMTDDEMARLFVPFEQASLKTNRQFGGTGLGLAISRRLVELMDGDITVDSTHGAGSKFRFDIAVPQPEPQADAPPALQGVNIMLLGDRSVGNATVIAMLENAGATVALCQDPELAHEAAQQASQGGRPFDILLLDELVKHQHCIHWLKQIRRHENLSTMPASVLVRRSSRSLVSRLREQDVGSIIMKVVRAGNLAESITRVLARSAGLETAASLNPDTATAKDSTWQRIRFPDTKVLVADDSRVNQYVVRKMLEHLGVTVRTVETGREALQALTEDIGVYHLVFMDCFLPDIEGFDVVRQLRADEEGHQDRLPVVALSASQLPEDVAASLEAGMDDYVSKPTDIATLAEVLNKWLPAECRRVVADESEALAAGAGPAFQSKLGKVSMAHEAEKAGVDLSKILNIYGDLNSRAKGLVDIFLRDVPTFISDLESGVEERDSDRVRFAAHSIAGSCGVVGAIELSHAAQQVEYDARDGDWQKVESDTPVLVGQYERVCHFFELAEWQP